MPTIIRGFVGLGGAVKRGEAFPPRVVVVTVEVWRIFPAQPDY